MIDQKFLQSALTKTLAHTNLIDLGRRYEGKVRDNYTTPDGRRFIVVTDRVSAFDHVLGTIPYKGQVLNRLAAWWFERTAHVAKNHMVRLADPNVLECVECTPLPVEMVMRSYITGSTSTSMWTHYADGARIFCGHTLPDGLKKNQKLERPILTPATKAAPGEHDISRSREQILAMGTIPPSVFDEAATLAFALFAEGQKLCTDRGLILVDTKYEFGRTPSGEVVVIDEIHTPDSSRFWVQSAYATHFAKGEDPEPLDKDFIRRSYAETGYRGDGDPPPLTDPLRLGAAQRYIDAYERITGEPFHLNEEDPLRRIRRNLGLSA